jgi:DNA polymerase
MTDPTRFDLDERQRAMLAEMGVRVWWPQSAPAAEPVVPAVPDASVASVAPVAAPALATPSAPPPAPSVVRAAAPAAAMPVAAVAAPVVATTPLPAGIDQMDWDTLQAAVAECRACGLCQGRKNTVFGVGERRASWMVIGEAPVETEDQQGEPFVGQAGQLLDNMLKAIGLNRRVQGGPQPQPPGDPAPVYIAHALKCRPPGDRNPEPPELQTCAPYLARQVALVQPRIILAMGRFAVQTLLQTTEPLGKLRGRVHTYQGVSVVVTYSPAYLLRNPADKAKAWADLCLALQTAQQA